MSVRVGSVMEVVEVSLYWKQTVQRNECRNVYILSGFIDILFMIVRLVHPERHTTTGHV